MNDTPRCAHPDGCPRLRRKREWCETHYNRWRATGDLGPAHIPPRGGKPKGRICEVPKCHAKHYARGLCTLHYQRIRINGTTEPLERTVKLCSVEGCPETYAARDLCHTHYARWSCTGDPGPADIIGQPPGWIGDAAGYKAVHKRLNRQRGLATERTCQHCHGPAAEWAYDHQDPNERTDPDHQGCRYSVDLARYFPLCISCHRRFDLGRPVNC